MLEEFQEFSLVKSDLSGVLLEPHHRVQMRILCVPGFFAGRKNSKHVAYNPAQHVTAAAAVAAL